MQSEFHTVYVLQLLFVTTYISSQIEEIILQASIMQAAPKVHILAFFCKSPIELDAV